MEKYSLLVMGFLFSSVTWAQSVVVDVTLNPVGDFKAKTTEVKGEALKVGEEVRAEGIRVNLKSLNTGIELRNEHTLKYLEVDKHPEAILVKARGKGGKGVAKINIKGIEKEVRGTYKIIESGKKLEATFPLTLSDFDIKDISYKNTVGVEDEVQLTVVVPLKEEAAK